MKPVSASDSVSQWIHQLKEGERPAVQPLLERYFDRLIRLARSRLRSAPGLDAYEEDIALSALKSLCMGLERGRFAELYDRDDLWRLLATITIRKAIDLTRRKNPAAPQVEPQLEQLFSSEPTPDDVAEMAEEYQRLMNALDEPELRQIALWKFEGLTNDEIAQQLGCASRTVERKLHRIRLLWEAFLGISSP